MGRAETPEPEDLEHGTHVDRPVDHLTGPADLRRDLGRDEAELRVLWHPADVERERAASPTGQGRTDRAGHRPDETAEHRESRRLAGTARTDHGGEGTRLEREVQPVESTGPLGAAQGACHEVDRDVLGLHGQRPAVRPDELIGHVDRHGRRQARHPEALDRRRREERGDGAVERDTATGQHDHPVDVVEPRLEPVLDDDQGARTGHVEHGIAHRRGVVGVEHRGGLVEQQHVGTQGQHAGQSQSLTLAPGQCGGEVVASVRQPHRVQRRVDPLPDLVAREGKVLRPERDVTPDAVGDDGVVRVLRQETEPPLHHGLAVHLAGDGRAQRAGEGVQQRRLAGTARAEQQHALAGRDLEIEVPHHGLAAPQRTPGEAGETDPAGFHQTSVTASRPGPNASSTPARANARVSSQPPTPATTTPDRVRKPRWASL